jgi:hypothetical protein
MFLNPLLLKCSVRTECWACRCFSACIAAVLAVAALVLLIRFDIQRTGASAPSLGDGMKNVDRLARCHLDDLCRDAIASGGTL